MFSILFYHHIDSRIHNTLRQRQITLANPHSSSSPVMIPTSPKLVESNTSPNKTADYSKLTDEEIISMIKSKKLSAHNLEKHLPFIRAVYIRRFLLSEQLMLSKSTSSVLDSLSYEHYDYSLVVNQCCENVIGYVEMPVGYAGPLRVDDKNYYIPMATTEGEIFLILNVKFR